MPPLSDRDRDLAHLAQSTGGDWVLDRLLILGNLEYAALAVSLVVVAGGVTFRGQLATSEELAGSVDERLTTILRNAESTQPELLEVIHAFQKALGEDSFTADTARRRQRAQAIQEKIAAARQADPDAAIEESLEREQMAMLHYRTAFTLKDAFVLNGRSWDPIGMVRIVTSTVSAWWLPGLE